MFHVVLFQPEIPPNTGTIMRMGAATGLHIHLIEPLGFNLSNKSLQRAGMDYCERVDYHRHINWDICHQFILTEAKNKTRPPPNCYAITTKAKKLYTTPIFNIGDVFVFGPETRGLPQQMLALLGENQQLRIPMKTGERSLNLAMSVAIISFEALRQQEFELLS